MNKIRLNSVKRYFLESLVPKYIMPYMLEYKVVTEQESEKILSLTSSNEQVEKLIEILSSKGPKEFENFIEVLKIEDELGESYLWLAEKLAETNFAFEIGKRRDLKDRVYEMLTEGGVPFQTNCLLHRKDKVNRIREMLKKASDNTFYSTAWVVLHGMSGTGKSVLAAESLRDNELIEKHFPHGVFWVSLGNKIDNNSLEIRMTRLFKKILKSQRISDNDNKYNVAFENLDELKENLKNLVVNRKMLIVLDKLWENLPSKINVVKLFDIGCPILVTTKFIGAFEHYTQNCYKDLCANDLLVEESKELLSLYVDCDKEDLPPVADDICKKCRGSPFTLSHIGRWMSPYGNNPNRWQYLMNLLESGLANAMRRQNSSGELNEIKEIVLLTLQPLEKYKDFFYDFAIFPEDVWVPAQVFTVLWDKDVFEVEETMYSLVRNSLVQFEKDPDGYCYGIHDLYLEILKEICPNIQERHLRLVNNYLKLCKREEGKFDYNRLPNDDYIHYYMGYHISSINKEDIIDGISLDDIYFNFNFMEKKLQKDPKDLLWDYHNYTNLFDNKEFLEIFKSFASKHAYSIYNNRDCDIIQLGLFEPQSSIIYLRALDMALNKQNNKSYFEWCNWKENESYLQNFNIKLNPFENARHAAISSDGLLVGCVGSENKAYVFSSSGEELLKLTGHTAAINYCIFNSSRDRLVTASDDKTVRIFEIYVTYTSDMKPTKKRTSLPVINVDVSKTPDVSVVTFAQHHASVLCCCYSHDEDLIVSSDSVGIVHVWQSSTAYIKCNVRHLHTSCESFKPVNVCCFNSDSSLFGTAAYDSVQLWHTNTGEPFKKFSHEDMLVNGFCISNYNLVTSVADNKIYKNSIETEISEIISGSKNLVFSCCCLSPDGNFFACGTSENSVIVYNINSGKLINNLKGHNSVISSVMFSGDGKKILAVSEKGYILYDISHNKDSSLVCFEGNLSVQQDSNDLMIVSSNYFDSIEVRKGSIGKLICKTESDSSEISACSLSPDCSEVVYGTKDGCVKVLNIKDNNVVDLPQHSDQINYIIHSKSNLFFTCSEDKTAKVWCDRLSSKVLRGHHQSVVMCVPFKKTYKLLTCSKDGTLRVWEIDSGKTVLITEGHGNQDIRFCDISFNEKLLASASADCTVKLWNAENGDIYKILHCSSEVRCCRFSPSFQILISGCDDGEVRLWNLGKKPTSKLLYYHSSCVYNIYFSKDGSQSLSIADDIKIRTDGQSEPQTLLLPSSSMGVARPSIWTSDNFDQFVLILNTVLYILKKILHKSKI